MKYYELHLTIDLDGTDSVVGLFPGKTKREAHDLGVKEYRKSKGLPASRHVFAVVINEVESYEEAVVFHNKLMEAINQRNEND